LDSWGESGRFQKPTKVFAALSPIIVQCGEWVGVPSGAQGKARRDREAFRAPEAPAERKSIATRMQTRSGPKEGCTGEMASDQEVHRLHRGCTGPALVKYGV